MSIYKNIIARLDKFTTRQGIVSGEWCELLDMLESERKELEAKNDELERKLSSIIDDCIAENAYEFSQYCQSIDYGYTKEIKELEAKNGELEEILANEETLRDHMNFIGYNKLKELEKKLADAELIRDCNASQRDAAMRSLKIAVKALERILNTYKNGTWTANLVSRQALAAINGEGV